MDMDIAAAVEAMSDPTRAPYLALRATLLAAKRKREESEQDRVPVKKLPMRVYGADFQRLQKEFGWHFKVIDRCCSMVPYAEAKTFCCSTLNMEMKAWDGEEVLTYDADMVTHAVRNTGWMHVCRTNRNASVAASYVEQETQLERAVKGSNVNVSLGATKLLKQLRSGGGDSVCLDSAVCGRVVDTILIDMHKVDVSADQLAKTIAQHQATRAKIWFYFETEMFFEDSGELTSMDGTYVIDRDVDRVYIYPQGQDKLTYEYSFSVLMSYVLQSSVVVDGVLYVMEVHDSMNGVKFLQMTRSEFKLAEDSVVDVHYYRPNAEDMYVLEQQWKPVISDRSKGWVDLQPGQQYGRIVMPVVVVDKILSRVLASTDKRLTLETAREAVRDAFSQEITHGTVVKRPKTYAYDVFEQMSQFAYKYALRQRLEMQSEVKKLKKTMLMMRSDKTDWISVVLALMADCGMSYKAAIVEACRNVAAGVPVEVDYRVYKTKLDLSMVVRNVIRAHRVPNEFGARRVSHMPGAWSTSSANTSLLTADVIKSRARAVVRRADEERIAAMGAEVEDIMESGYHDSSKRMSDDRDALVEKLSHQFDAHNQVVTVREQAVQVDVSEPLTTAQVHVADPVVVINDDYQAIFPELDEVDMSVRTHLASSADRVEDFFASERRINRDLDRLAEDQNVRKSKIKTAGGGKRIVTSAETAACFNKRVLNAPRAQHMRIFEQTVHEQFEKFAKICLRPDYKKIIQRRMDEGMWSSRVSALSANVRKTDQSKVTRMLTESFCVGEIDFSKWKAMVKSTPKPKMSQSVAYEHTVTQTIIYQESKTENAYFSSMMSEFHDTFDECLLPNVKVNVRRDMEAQEKWFNAYNVRRDTAGAAVHVYEADISQCDKSHTLFSWVLYLHFMQVFGMPAEMADVLSVMAGKKEASAAMVGMLPKFIEELTSGAFLTISFNSIVCASAVVNAMDFGSVELLTAQFVGDDSLVETIGPVDVGKAADYLREMYNFESKMFESQVRYFCSRYYVRYDGYYFLMRDPLKLAESLGKHVSAVADVWELYQSYVDGARHYDKKEPCEALGVACARRMRLDRAPFGMISGISTLMDAEKYPDIFEEVVTTLSA